MEPGEVDDVERRHRALVERDRAVGLEAEAETARADLAPDRRPARPSGPRTLASQVRSRLSAAGRGRRRGG